MKPLPRAVSGGAYTLDGDVYNYIAETLERLDKWSVSPPINLQQTAAGNLLSMNLPNNKELALVRIIGVETGGGKYQASMMTGGSTGNTSNNFQLEASTWQSASDGPAFTPTPGSPTVPLNNALVINIREQYVAGSHILFDSSGNDFYTIGRVMGTTSEATPRTIVYVEDWTVLPAWAQITGATSSALGGTYKGKIVTGLFGGPGNTQGFALGGPAPAAEDCFISNHWEQLYLSGTGESQIPTGTYVPGFITGMPWNNLAGTGSFYMFWTWFPLQMPAIGGGIPALVTTQTAGASYTPTEQAMLNNLKTDGANLRATVQTLYANLKNAGYSL